MDRWIPADPPQTGTLLALCTRAAQQIRGFFTVLISQPGDHSLFTRALKTIKKSPALGPPDPLRAPLSNPSNPRQNRDPLRAPLSNPSIPVKTATRSGPSVMPSVKSVKTATLSGPYYPPLPVIEVSGREVIGTKTAEAKQAV